VAGGKPAGFGRGDVALAEAGFLAALGCLASRLLRLRDLPTAAVVRTPAVVRDTYGVFLSAPWAIACPVVAEMSWPTARVEPPEMFRIM
jgi:hypothetical protein